MWFLPRIIHQKTNGVSWIKLLEKACFMQILQSALRLWRFTKTRGNMWRIAIYLRKLLQKHSDQRFNKTSSLMLFHYFRFPFT